MLRCLQALHIGSKPHSIRVLYRQATEELSAPGLSLLHLVILTRIRSPQTRLRQRLQRQHLVANNKSARLDPLQHGTEWTSDHRRPQVRWLSDLVHYQRYAASGALTQFALAFGIRQPNMKLADATKYINYIKPLILGGITPISLRTLGNQHQG
jgi:hypothetical protein